MTDTNDRRITIVDVAAHANVSTAAVSKVIRDAYGVSPSMRAKVVQAIDELGYRPRAAARGMRGQTYTIGVMLPDLRNPFFPEIVDGIAEHLGATQYQLLFGTSFCGRQPEARVTDAMIDRGMDALILVAPTAPRQVLDKTAREIPVVVVGRHVRSRWHDTVVDDDARGAALVVHHLAELGHVRIAHIEHRDRAPADQLMPNVVRAAGYRAAMEELDLGAHVQIASTSYTEQGGHEGARRLLDQTDPPTAIFAGADIAAMGVLTAVTDAGLSVPGDISVVGYDNTGFAAMGPISLTSVDQSGMQMGREAARLALERITDRSRSATVVTTSPTLVLRRSSGATPARSARGRAPAG